MAEQQKSTSKAATKNATGAKAGKNGKTTTKATSANGARSGQLFQPVTAPTKVDYPLLEDATSALGGTSTTSCRSICIATTARDKRWSFIDGPITANNPMGVHHAWGRTYKDLFPALQHHARLQAALPEWLRLPGSLGRGRDREGAWLQQQARHRRARHRATSSSCARQRVCASADRIAKQSIRLGEWMDWADSYYTLSDENNYTIWGFLKTCWRARLALSRPRCDAVVPALRHRHLRHGDQRGALEGPAHQRLRALPAGGPRPASTCWSGRRRPGRLPANVAGRSQPRLDYAKVEQDGDYLLPSSSRGRRARKLKKLRGHEHGESRWSSTLKGASMVGWRYHRPLRRAARVANSWQSGAPGRSPGTRSAPPRAPASCISRRAVAARTSRSPKQSPCQSWRRWMRAASTSAATTG